MCATDTKVSKAHPEPCFHGACGPAIGLLRVEGTGGHDES